MAWKHCHELATDAQKILIQQLSDILPHVNTIEMTTDIWTDNYHKSYMTVACHFVTQLMSKVLPTAMFPLDETKTSENIRREIIRLLTEYGLDISALNKAV